VSEQSAEQSAEMVAAHRRDAERQIDLGRPVAASTVRGLLDALASATASRDARLHRVEELRKNYQVRADTWPTPLAQWADIARDLSKALE